MLVEVTGVQWVSRYRHKSSVSTGRSARAMALRSEPRGVPSWSGDFFAVPFLSGSTFPRLSACAKESQKCDINKNATTPVSPYGGYGYWPVSDIPARVF